MHPVENKILNYLLDKYENSKLSRGENQRAIHIAFPFNKKTMPKYFDESSLEIETIHAAAEQMEREGLVAIAWKNQKPGYIIEKLVLCEIMWKRHMRGLAGSRRGKLRHVQNRFWSSFIRKRRVR